MKLESSLINTFRRVKARAVSLNTANDFHRERKHTAGMLRTFWSFDTLVFQTISKKDSCDSPQPLVLQRPPRSQRAVCGMTGGTLEGKWSSG